MYFPSKPRGLFVLFAGLIGLLLLATFLLARRDPPAARPSVFMSQSRDPAKPAAAPDSAAESSAIADEAATQEQRLVPSPAGGTPTSLEGRQVAASGGPHVYLRRTAS